MRTSLIAVLVFLLIPMAYAEDEVVEDPVEPEPEPVSDMIAGEYTCHEYPKGTVHSTFEISATTLGNFGICELNHEGSNLSCKSSRSDFISMVSAEGLDCSNAYASDDYTVAVHYKGTFVCRGTRVDMVNLAADLCEYAYMH